MASHRPIVLGLIVTALAAAAFLLFAPGGETPVAPQTRDEQPAAASPAAAPVRGDDGSVSTTAPTDGTGRVAVGPGSGVDERLPGLIGRVVGPDGRPIAGAKVSAAPGVGFGDANGFDLRNLEELADGAFEPGAMLRSLREQVADRVEVETDADGRFRVVAKGSSRNIGLRVLARSHGILDRRFDRPREQDADVGTLTLQAAAVVSGRVLTAGGAPIAGARVGRVMEMEQRFLGRAEFDVPELGELELLRGGEGTLTDELGQFELAHVAPGELTLRARHPEHPTARSQPLRVEAGRELSGLLVTMEIGGVITGVVSGLPADAQDLQVQAAKKPRLDGNDGGAAGAMGNFGVDLAGLADEAGFTFAERTATIAADGTFELRGLARDTWRIWVARTSGTFAGAAACSARVEAQPGGSVQLLFDPGITVTFTAVDGKTGAPVERLTVRDRLRGASGGGINDLIAGMAARGGMSPRRFATYPKGAVTVANLRPKADQKLALTIEAIGYATFERADIELPKTGNLDLGELRLEPVPVLHVTVVAADGGRAVAGARVRFASAGTGDGGGPGGRDMARELRRFLPGGGSVLDSGRTDQDGRITLNRPLQAAAIEVDAREFAPFSSEPINFSAAGPETHTAQLLVGGAVAVTVHDPADKPVAGALVEHRSPTGNVASRRADPQGIARFEHLPPGTHQFRLGKEGGDRARMRWGGPDAGGAEPAPGEPAWQPLEVADKASASLRLVAQPTATLRGIVRENGVPLANALVAFREGAAGAAAGNPLSELAERFGGRAGGGRRGGRSVRTDAQGAYELRELPAGEHHLRITHDARAMPVTMPAVVRDGDNPFDVDLETTTLRGTVKDSQGNPVSGASIRVRRPRSSGDPANEIGDAIERFGGARMGGGGAAGIKTDANGVYEVRGVDPDVELEILATNNDCAPAAVKATATRGGTTAAPDVVLLAAGKVRVTVAGGQPFGAVRARWLGAGEGVAPVLGALRGGKGTLDGLRPGSWEITVESMESLGGRFGARLGGRQDGQQQQPAQPAAPQQKRTVEVIAGQTIDVEL